MEVLGATRETREGTEKLSPRLLARCFKNYAPQECLLYRLSLKKKLGINYSAPKRSERYQSLVGPCQAKCHCCEHCPTAFLTKENCVTVCYLSSIGSHQYPFFIGRHPVWRDVVLLLDGQTTQIAIKSWENVSSNKKDMIHWRHFQAKRKANITPAPWGQAILDSCNVCWLLAFSLFSTVSGICYR